MNNVKLVNPRGKIEIHKAVQKKAAIWRGEGLTVADINTLAKKHGLMRIKRK